MKHCTVSAYLKKKRTSLFNQAVLYVFTFQYKLLLLVLFECMEGGGLLVCSSTDVWIMSETFKVSKDASYEKGLGFS